MLLSAKSVQTVPSCAVTGAAIERSYNPNLNIPSVSAEYCCVFCASLAGLLAAAATSKLACVDMHLALG